MTKRAGSASGSVNQRYPSENTVRIRGYGPASGSQPKCHGSGTPLFCILDRYRYLGRRRDVEGIPWPLKGTGADPCPPHPRPELRPRLTNTTPMTKKGSFFIRCPPAVAGKNSNRVNAVLKVLIPNWAVRNVYRYQVLHIQVSSNLKLFCRC